MAQVGWGKSAVCPMSVDMYQEEQLAPVIQQLYDEVLKRGEISGGPELVLVIDDADTLSKQLNDFNVKDQLGAIVESRKGSRCTRDSIRSSGQVPNLWF